MKIIADLHLHSKYSRATSPLMEPETMSVWAKKKGIGIVGTGDFTHSAYLKELQEKLKEDGSGLLSLKQTKEKTRFMLTGEISCIYKHKDKTRRVHICVNIPDFATAIKIQKELESRNCNIRSDGRPIIGMSARDLTELCLDVNEKTMIIPAHIWTPWFAVFGSKSGYDSLEECFEDLTPNIYAAETGLSSDPEMNWRLSELDNITLISNSDAHSPANLGREANVFELEEETYDEIYEIIKTKNRKKFLYTIEFYPQEGKYHSDGHLSCNFVCSPQESKKKHKNLCPKCKKSLVLGVDHRVEDLSDRKVGFKPKNAIPYKSIVPLQEIISEVLQKGKKTKTVNGVYEELIAKGESEFNVLLNLNREQLEEISSREIAEGIIRVREGKVEIQPGYDGQFGVVRVFSESELQKMNKRKRF